MLSSLQNRFRGKPITYTLHAAMTTSYIVIIALDSCDEAAANSLDSITSRFIHRFSRLHVCYSNTSLRKIPLMMAGVSSAKQTSVFSLNVWITGSDSPLRHATVKKKKKMETIESDSAVHVVRFPTQLGEHLDRIVLRLGFLKNSSVQLDDCIASYRI